MTTNISKSSSPSELKITDMRIAVIGKGGWRWPIIKIFTNQDIIGWAKYVMGHLLDMH